MLKKVQMNLEEGLIAQIDEYAKALHISRTAAVSVLVSRALQDEALKEQMPVFVQALQQLQGLAKVDGAGLSMPEVP